MMLFKASEAKFGRFLAKAQKGRNGLHDLKDGNFSYPLKWKGFEKKPNQKLVEKTLEIARPKLPEPLVGGLKDGADYTMIGEALVRAGEFEKSALAAQKGLERKIETVDTVWKKARRYTVDATWNTAAGYARLKAPEMFICASRDELKDAFERWFGDARGVRNAAVLGIAAYTGIAALLWTVFEQGLGMMAVVAGLELLLLRLARKYGAAKQIKNTVVREFEKNLSKMAIPDLEAVGKRLQDVKDTLEKTIAMNRAAVNEVTVGCEGYFEKNDRDVQDGSQ